MIIQIGLGDFHNAPLREYRLPEQEKAARAAYRRALRWERENGCKCGGPVIKAVLTPDEIRQYVHPEAAELAAEWAAEAWVHLDGRD
jgi:hypothetical protein